MKLICNRSKEFDCERRVGRRCYHAVPHEEFIIEGQTCCIKSQSCDQTTEGLLKTKCVEVEKDE